MRPSHRLSHRLPHRLLALITLAALATACGSSAASKSTASSSTSTTAPGTPAMSTTKEMYAGRYCEILLVQPGASSITAQVYNTYTLSACPQPTWEAIDTGAIAKQEGVPFAQRNGPRYWLMDSVSKIVLKDKVQKDFGGLQMYKLATVELGGSIIDAQKKYVPHAVHRETIFTFNAGRTVHELVAADGTTYVMQSWSQQIDPALAETGLADIGSRLQLPAGWKYQSRKLTKPMRVVTTTTDAHVLQDDLMNSYSQETAG